MVRGESCAHLLGRGRVRGEGEDCYGGREGGESEKKVGKASVINGTGQCEEREE